MALLFVITVIIFFSFYLFTTTAPSLSLRDRIILSSILSWAQIILTQFILSLVGWLYLPLLISLNIILATTISFLCLQNNTEIKSIATLDFLTFKNLFSRLSPPNRILFVLLIFACLWIIWAGILFPPRGVDDLTYHLPPIYQAIQQHRWQLLPLDLKTHFAFPFFAEFLFMWPAIFTHSQQYVDLVQLFVALSGLPTIYALGRYLKLSFNTSILIALLFMLTPVVLMQSGCNYIDLITSIFFLNSLYLSLMFYRYQKPIYLYALAVSLGLMIGMKYMMPFLALFLQPLIIPKLCKNKRHLFWYIFIIFVIGSYWYIKNFLLLGTFFYTQGTGTVSIEAFNGHGQIAWKETLALFWQKWHKMFIEDIELGKFNGGFGLIFWALSFPTWIVIFIRSILRFKKNPDLFWLWVQLPLALPFVLFWPLDQIDYTVRYIIYIIPIGYLCFGLLLEALKRNGLHKLKKIFEIICLVCGYLYVSLMSISYWPTYDLTVPLEDLKNSATRNEYYRLRNGTWYIHINYYIWELIEDISRTQQNGLSCYLASTLNGYWTAPLYGLKLQNTIYNFEENPKSLPDLYYFTSHDHVPNQPLLYIGKQFKLSDVSLRNDYILIYQVERKFIFIKKDLLKNISVKKSLLNFYTNYLPILTKESLPPLQEHVPLISTDWTGSTFRYWELEGAFKSPVIWIPPSSLNRFLSQTHWQKLYSLNTPLQGYKSKTLYKLINDEFTLVIYENIKE